MLLYNKDPEASSAPGSLMDGMVLHDHVHRHNERTPKPAAGILPLQQHSIFTVLGLIVRVISPIPFCHV
jgi:hypothetical protein